MNTDPIVPSENVPGSTHQPVVPPTVPPITPGAAPVAPGTAPVDPILTTAPLAEGTGLTPNVAAGLAVLFTLISGIIFLLIEKRDQFVRFWAMQAIFFGGAWFVFGIVSAVIGTVLGHVFWLLALLWHLFALLIWLGFLAVWIVMLIKAFSAKEWEIPYLGKLARQQLATLPKG